MQNFTKSQTRLAFIQFIFQSEFLKSNFEENIEEFQNHFYNSNISAIDEKKEFKIRFNKTFLNKLYNNYKNNFDKINVIEDINNFIEINRKFEKWDNILKSLIFAIISEFKITEKNKIKIVLNDYLNISKSLVSLRETKLLNAIIQKYLDKYDI